ncbi:MAG: hypothetical protein HUU35_02610, partial [Armatimonadetes bacterium]|nr:hypothetical protein [Armatimonadota bacterium]
MWERLNGSEHGNGQVVEVAPATKAAAPLPAREEADSPVPRQTVESFWNDREPRDPRQPHDYLPRKVLWFNPPVDPQGDAPRLEELLQVAEQKLPCSARLLRWVYHNHVVRAALESLRLQQAVERRLAEQNAWITAENQRVEWLEEPARQRLEQAEAELHEAEQAAGRACSDVGFAYQPGRTETQQVAAMPAELTARTLPATTPELEAATAPLRNPVAGRWISWLAPLPLGCVLGLALFHFAGLVRGEELIRLKLVWDTLLVAWLCIGTPLYYVLGHGLRAAARRCYWWCEELAGEGTPRRLIVTWGMRLLAAAVALPLLAEAVVEGAAFRHLNAELAARANLALEATAGAVPSPSVVVYYVAAALMSSLFVLSEFQNAFNDEEDHAVERRNRLQAAAQRTCYQDQAREVRLEAADAAAARLAEPAVQEALGAVSAVVAQRQTVA